MRTHLRLTFGLGILLAFAGCGSKGLSPRSGMVEVPGGKVWYQIVGSGAKTPLLVLHGGPGIPSDYLRNLDGVAADRPVIFYDQLGCGRSPAPDDTALWTITRFVRELEGVRAELGLRRVHLLGHSWGTILALEYLKTHPDGVESVVMASPALDIHQWSRDADSLKHTLPDSSLRVIEAGEANGATDTPAYQAAVSEFYGRYVSRRQPWSAHIDSAFARMNPALYAYMNGPSEFTLTGTLRGYDGRAALPGLKLPALYTCGEFDEALPRTVASFAAATPGAGMRIFPGAAHVTMEDDSAAYVSAIRAFLDTVDARSASR